VTTQAYNASGWREKFNGSTSAALEYVGRLMREADDLGKAGKSKEALTKHKEAESIMNDVEAEQMAHALGRKLDGGMAPPRTVEARPVVDANDRSGEPEYQRAFAAYINQFTRPEGFGSLERDVLTIASDPDGGYTVPVDRRPEIVRPEPAVSEVLALVNSVPAAGKEVEWVKVQAHASSPDIFTSAFVGSMAPETGGNAETAPKFEIVTVPMKKGRAAARFSMDLASDSGIDLTNFLQVDGGLNLTLLREQQVLVGDGIGNNLNGVMNNADVIALGTTDVSGTTADQISNTLADLGSVPKLINFIQSVPAQYRRMPSFRLVMNSDTETKVMQLVDATGRPAWGEGGLLGPRTDASGGKTLLGYKIAISEFLASGGTNGNKVILAGPLAEILAPIRSAVSVQVLVERYAELDMLAMILRTRFGAVIGNPRAFRIAVV
jgi:HK97 family phage major capsid protein